MDLLQHNGEHGELHGQEQLLVVGIDGESIHLLTLFQVEVVVFLVVEQLLQLVVKQDLVLELELYQELIEDH